MNNLTTAVKHLLLLNGIFFIGSLTLGDSLIDLFSLHYFENPRFRWWQIFAHMFMHAGPSHIFFNMFALWMFGAPLEQIWGRQKFIFYYLSSGLGAAALQMFVYHYEITALTEELKLAGISNEELKSFFVQGKIPLRVNLDTNVLEKIFAKFNVAMVGASGAIYGILVAFAFAFPNARLMLLFPPIPIKAKVMIPVLILIDIFFGLTSYSFAPVAHFAHVGGALTGLLMVIYWKKKQFDNNRWN